MKHELSLPLPYSCKSKLRVLRNNKRRSIIDFMVNISIHFFKTALIVASFGAVLVSVSEFWFYEVSEEVSSIGVLLAYGLLGYVFLLTLERYHTQTFAGWFVGAALFGFLIEGVVVPVLYSAPPFTIVWTSLAWHALITIWLCWWVFRHIMANQSWYIALGFNALLGLGFGMWNAYMWNAVESEGAEPLFYWQPTEVFAEQFLFGYVLFLLGHILFAWVYRSRQDSQSYEYYGLWLVTWIIAILTGVASGLWFFWPILPVLVLLCLWSMRAGKKESLFGDSESYSVYEKNQQAIPWWRYSFTLLIPLVAIVVYDLLVTQQIGLEMNFFLIVTAGPISVWWFLRSLYQLHRR